MQAEPRGLVRLSCPLGLLEGIAASLPSFLADYPMLRVESVITNRRVDLVHEGIDVAVRVRERLDTDADLQMKRIGVSRRILAASPAFLKGSRRARCASGPRQPSRPPPGAAGWRDLASHDRGRTGRLRDHAASHGDGQLRNIDSSGMPGYRNRAAAGR